MKINCQMHYSFDSYESCQGIPMNFDYYELSGFELDDTVSGFDDCVLFRNIGANIEEHCNNLHTEELYNKYSFIKNKKSYIVNELHSEDYISE